MHAPHRFRPSTYGDPASRVESPSDWLYLHANEFWFDDSGYLFVILGGAGLQTLYAPTGQVSAKFFARGDAVTNTVVDVIRSRGRRATEAEVAALKAGATTPTTPTTPTATTATTATTFTIAQDAAPQPKKKKRRIKSKAPVLYERAWFPFAVGGAAIVVVGLIAVALRGRRAQGVA